MRPLRRSEQLVSDELRSLLALRSGDQDRAQLLAEEALRVIDSTQQSWKGADLRRWLSVIPRASGDSELERRMLQEGEQIYARKEIRSYDTEIRHRLAELENEARQET